MLCVVADASYKNLARVGATKGTVVRILPTLTLRDDDHLLLHSRSVRHSPLPTAFCWGRKVTIGHSPV